MKIAVFLSGQVREFDTSYKTILNVFNEHEVDFYFHFWENSDYSKDWILDTLNPKGYKFESQVDFLPQVNMLSQYSNRERNSPFVFNVCSQHYSLSQVKHIIPDPHQYDFIAKIRTDMYFDKPLNSLIETIIGDELLISRLGSNAVTYPKVTGDIAFLSTPNTFVHFFSLYDFLTTPDKWSRKLKNVSLTSHHILKAFFDHHNIQHKHVPFYFTLIRPEITGSTYEDIMKSYKQYFQPSQMKQKLFKFNNPDRVTEFESI